MPTRSSKQTRPPRSDVSQLAKRILDEAIGEAPKTDAPPPKNQAAVELGRLGGKKGGAARSAALSDEQKKAIALKAARARWDKANKP
jgi:hypothetical protein